MKLKYDLPAIALLLIALLAGCEKDLVTDQVTGADDGMSLLLKAAPAGSPVATHGQIYVSGKNMKDKNNATMNLRGQSFGWSSWWPHYWNERVVRWLASDFNVDIIRAAMGINKISILSLYKSMSRCENRRFSNSEFTGRILIIA